MARKPLTRKAALVLGGITAHFAPRFALDKAIDFTPVVATIDAKNYAGRKAQLTAAVLKAVEGRLAMDADAEGLAKLLDALSSTAPAEAKDDAEPVIDPNAAAAPPAKEGEKDPAAVDPVVEPAKAEGEDPDVTEDDDGDGDGDAIAQARTFLASKLSPEDLNHFNSLVARIGGEEVPAEDAEDPDAAAMTDPAADPAATDPAIPPAGEKKPGAEDEEEDMIPKSAMDAAVAARAKPMIAAALAAHDAATKATFAAKDAVEKALGKVVACDSATDYYRLGLKGFGVKSADTLPASALQATFDALAEARAATPRAKPAIAQDASADADYVKRFPNAGRLAR
jgi:hypothetical protein